MRVIHTLKIQNGWVGKGNNRCEDFRPPHSQPRPHSQGFPFVIAFKEASGRPEVSRTRKGEKQSHYMVACEGGGVL